MDKDQQEQKRFLEKQQEWSKEQGRVLDEITAKLYEMKEIAEYALIHDLTIDEIEELNGQLSNLTEEIHDLEKQLHFIVH